MTSRIMTRALLPTILLLASAGALAASPQQKEPLDVDASERLSAKNSVGGSRKLSLQKMEPSSLDGVKGYRVYPSAEGPSLKDTDELRRVVAHMACHTAVFGLVELEAAKPFVGQDDVGIFTKFRFRVIDDWRANGAGSGRTVDLVMMAGEVSRDGERYRIENPHALYEVGGRYVLIAGTKSQEQKTIFGSPPFLEISDDMIHPAPGWTPFAPGSTVQQAKSEVVAALVQEGCK